MRALVVALLLAASAAGAATYDVGPGQPLATIGAVPWAALVPGDLVQIHWQPLPYREKWVICRQGTQAQPIVVRGVPGPGGLLPVIDGEDAVTAPGLDFWNDERGIIKIGGASVPADLMPQWIVVELLEIRGSTTARTFTDDRGAVRSYAANAAPLYVEKCEHLVLRGLELHDSGNGLFIGSPDLEPTRDVLVEFCRIWDNGNVGSAFEHDSYTAALGITFQYNWYGWTKLGANGNNLKDRSAGLVVRYNWIDAANRQLDLVDAEDSSVIANDPSYRDTYVYGNVLAERDGAGNRQVVHYGGDSGVETQYRKGTLHFYNNTVISDRTDRTTLFRLSTNEERCDARNNVIHVKPTAAAGNTLALLDDIGVLDWSHNVMRPGWVVAFFGSTGTFNDDGTTLTPASPLFVDEAGEDLHLAAGSPCVDAGTVLDAASLPANDVVMQYAKHQGAEARPRDAVLDVGAYERESCLFPAVPGIVTNVRVTKDPRTLAALLTWDAAPDAESWDVVRGNIWIERMLDLASSVEFCLANDSSLPSASDPAIASPQGEWYAVRATSCRGAGTWDSADPAQVASRDVPLSAGCP